MSKTYVKECMYCKQQIQMSDKSGNWLPYNLNNGPHDCRTNGNNGNVSEPIHQNGKGKKQDNEARVAHIVGLIGQALKELEALKK
jgi:hypothetical protein